MERERGQRPGKSDSGNPIDVDEICCFLIASTGHGWREIYDEWDFPRLNRWIEYCNDHPTLQAMVQAYLGIKRNKPIRLTEANFAVFMRNLQSGTL